MKQDDMKAIIYIVSTIMLLIAITAVTSIGDLDAMRVAHNKEDAEISYSIAKVVFIAVGTSISLVCLWYAKDCECKK